MSNNNDAITVSAPLNTNADDDISVNGSAVGAGSIRLILKGDKTGTNDTLTGGAGDDVLQVGYATVTSPGTDGVNQELEAADVFTGNGGTDVIEYHNVGDSAAASPTAGTGDITAIIDFDNITGVEKIQVMDADGVTSAADPIKTTIEALSATTTKMPATFEYDGSIITDTDDTQDFNYSSVTAADNDALTTDMTITTGAGADSVGGSGGDDIISTGAGADVVFGGGRSDTIDGGTGNDSLYGGDETALTGGGDSISGGAGADIIDGDGGADTILGGDGADIITGGAGADILTGGSGGDTFLLPTAAESGGTNLDTITDFTSASDSIKITLTAANIDTATDLGATQFAATDLGDVSTFAEVEAILSKKAGEAVFVKDSAQLVIDINGDANINSSDIRVNLTGATAYDDADVVYDITGLADETLTYALGDGADTFTADTTAGNGVASGNSALIETITGNGGADTITAKTIGGSVISGGAGNDIIDVSFTQTFVVATAVTADSTTALVLDDVTGLEVGTILETGTNDLTITAVNTSTKTATVTRGGTAANFAADAVLTTTNEGGDLVTGGAGNDTITFRAAVPAGETVPDAWIAVGATASAPYVGTNNGTDTVTSTGGARQNEFQLDALSSVTGTGTGSANWLKVRGTTDGDSDGIGDEDTTATQVLDEVAAAATTDYDVNASIYAYDSGLTAAMTKAQLVTQFKNGGSSDAFDMAANGAGIIIVGNASDSAVAPMQIFWIDSALDGDGTDVTVADVHLLVQTSANVDLDTFVVGQFT
jgi:Ca2+-binding RTX toxin-like protein